MENDFPTFFIYTAFHPLVSHETMTKRENADLVIGLTNDSLAWRLFLDQEKVPYEIVAHSKSHITPYPVLIITDAHFQDTELLDRHVQSGGKIILDSFTFQKCKKFISKFEVLIVPGNVKYSAQTWSSEEKSFELDGISVCEVVARNPKHVMRKQITDAIKKCFHQNQLPYVHLWYYPDKYQSVFAFRFDLDEYQSDDFDMLVRLSARYTNLITCFPCMRTYENLTSELNRLKATGVEIGSHGYIHHVYQNYTQNKLNLQIAQSKLMPYMTRKIFAGPHGKWHPSLHRTLEEEQYEYSSEFGLDYDSFPFFPILTNYRSNVLQVPVHPVCEGVFLQKYPYNETMFKHYYSTSMDYKYNEREPMLYFGHSTKRIGRYPNILHNTIGHLENFPNVWKTNMSSWVDWWKKRHHFIFSVNWSNGAITTKINIKNSQFALHICWPDGREELWSEGDFIRLKPTLQTSPIIEQPIAHSVVKKIKNKLKTFLDWEIKTPINQIAVVDIPTFLKKFFRKITYKR